MSRRTLVTCALPYANGPVHMGHIAGVYLPGDVYVKFLRLKGTECIFVCGTDEHGVPITISADQEQTSPAEIVRRYHAMQADAFAGLGIEFDIFSGTSTCPHHTGFSQEFFHSLNRAGHIEARTTAEYFCATCDRFLPDRYVEGSCPYCDSPDAKGDQCEACGNALDALKDPRCKVCGRKPEQRKTQHWFFRLDRYQERLRSWLESKLDWKENVRSFSLGVLDAGLKPRSITRDISWGVPVPLPEGAGKVLYVWFDAPIGYISFTRELAERRGDPDLWKRYWRDPETKLVHFIGKDNIIFHAVIWPAMLMGQKESYILPSEIPAFEYLHYKGGKFSKSKRRALWAHEYLGHFPPDLARYYLTAIAPESRDTNWTWHDFVARVNSDLADVVGNFVNRTLTFARKFCDGRVPDRGAPPETLAAVAAAREGVDAHLEGFRFREACKAFVDLAREGNRIFDKREPWAKRKDDPAHAEATIRGCLEIVAGLTVVSWPFLPHTAREIRSWLGLPEIPGTADFRGLGKPALKPGGVVAEPRILFEKLELPAVLDRVGETEEDAGPETQADEAKEEPVAEPAAAPAEIPFEAFQQVDIRVAKILKVERVPKADKLLQMEVDIGGETRPMVAGLALHYPDPAVLLNRHVVVVTNLKPAKIRGVESRAMILAAVAGDDVAVLVPDKDLPPGTKVS